MQLIATNFHNNKPLWTIKKLAKKTNMSQRAVTLVISTLENNKLITKVMFDETGLSESEPAQPKNAARNFLLAQAAENISIKMILDAARNAEETSELHPDDIDTTENVNNVIAAINNAITKSSQSKTLKDLI